ncbi:MAG: hypothetical protein Q9M28_07245 [Mariprofundaceae bacterium]|nr:hypothetical protein [Mariprofundaceae bacterium]
MRSDALIVLGMHRSGTSALAGVLELLGVDFGKHLLPAQSDNKKGFWEHADIIDLHDQIFSFFGSSWKDSSSLPFEWWQHSGMDLFKKRLISIVRKEFIEVPLWGLKDPRICRLLPIWNEVFSSIDSEPRFIIILRNPVEVAESLHKRDGITHTEAYSLWLRYMIEAERSTRGKDRVFVSYQSLLTNWSEVVEKISGNLSIQRPLSIKGSDRLVDDFLSPNLRHCIVSDFTMEKDEAISSWVKRLYQALNADKVNFAEILNLERSIMESDRLNTHSKTLSELKRQHIINITNLESSGAAKDLHITNLESSSAAKDLHITNLESSSAAKDLHITNLELSLATKDSHNSQLQDLTRNLISKRFGPFIWLGSQDRKNIIKSTVKDSNAN